MSDRFAWFQPVAGRLVAAGHRAWHRVRSTRPPDDWLAGLRAWLRPGMCGYCDLGLDPSSLAMAYALTLGFYLAVNAWLGGRIDRAYREHRPALFADASATSMAVNRLVDAGVADPKVRSWLESHLDLGLPAPAQVERLFRSVVTAEGDARAGRLAMLESLATGSRSTVWPLGYASARLATATDTFRELSEAEPQWRGSLAATDDHDEKQAVILWAVTDLLTATERPVRDYLRLNGWVQWITVLIAFLVAVLGVRRVLLLRRVRARWAGAIPVEPAHGDVELVAMADLLISNQEARASRAELTMILQEESGRLADGVEDRVYGTLGFLLGCLPSLGFIGTILGMGEALIRANGLLNAADREQTISQMTQQLGFAFDTTLVALLAGLAVGGGIAWVHHVERRWLQDLESTLVARVLPPEGAGAEAPASTTGDHYGHVTYRPPTFSGQPATGGGAVGSPP